MAAPAQPCNAQWEARWSGPSARYSFGHGSSHSDGGAHEGEAVDPCGAVGEEAGVHDAFFVGRPLPAIMIGMAVHERHVGLREQGAAAAGIPVGSRDGDLDADGAHICLHVIKIGLLDHQLEVEHGQRGVVGEIDWRLRRRVSILLAPSLVFLFQTCAIGLHKLFAVREDFVFVGDFGHDDDGIVLVRKLRVGIDMRPNLLAELLLQLDEMFVEIRLRTGGIRQTLRVFDAVAFTETTVCQHVEIDIDAVFLEGEDEIVEAVHAFRIKRPCVFK